MKLKEIGTIQYHPQQFTRFRSGEVVKEWATRYCELFDDKDIEIALNQAHLGYHFFEWLTAISIFESMGYWSLIEQYEFKRHQRKQAILQSLVTPEVFELLTNHSHLFPAQSPDLFVYKPDRSEWFFCEVKGPKDRLRQQQLAYFEHLAQVAGKPVYIVHLKEWQI